MTGLRLSDIARLMRGTLLQGNPEAVVSSFIFDSREATPGSFFFALKDKRDGHLFVKDAYERGASAACISERISGLPIDFGLILVEDTLKALQTLAGKLLAQSQLKVVGITGSIGKTSTKEFTARLLSEKFKVLKSPGNFNNQIGLPISILSMKNTDQVAILEMGMNHRGEIKRLTEIAPPDVAVLTGVAPVHLEFFRDLEEIALAKQEILEGARDGAVAVLNGDDPRVRKMAAEYKKGPVIFYGCSPDCQVRAENLQSLGWDGWSLDLIYGRERTFLRVPFLNQALVFNLLAACAVAFSFDLKLADFYPAFSDLPLVEQRGQLLRLKNEISIYDDSYNSNPVALDWVLKSLGRIPARRKIAVLGDMLELGPQEIEFHRRAGKTVAQSGWDYLVTVGLRAKHMAEGAVENGLGGGNISSFSEASEVGLWLKTILKPGDFLLVKGSRGLALEKIINFLKNELED